MEYQLNINHIENKLEMGSPPWGRTGAAFRPRGGRGFCRRRAPCRVAGSGKSRDRYPARGSDAAKWEAPWGAGRERGGREGAGRADAMRLVALRPLCPLAGGPGGLSRRPPVLGSGERQ